MASNPDETLSKRGMTDEAVDLTLPTRPEGFDADAFLRGVRATRRGVRIYHRADLIVVMDELADKIDALPDGPEVDALIDELEERRAVFREASAWYVVEGRSGEWVTHFRKTFAKDHKLDPGPWSRDAATDAELAARAAIITAQLHEQLTEDVSIETLEALYVANQAEFFRLTVVMNESNTERAAGSAAVTRDFSRRRSTGHRTDRRS